MVKIQRPKRIYRNKKGYYFLVHGKKRYIKLAKDIKENKLININIKNVLGYQSRKKRNTTSKKSDQNTKGQIPMKHDIFSKGYTNSGISSGLFFNRQFLPQLYPPTNNNDRKDDIKQLSDMITKLSTLPKIMDKTEPPKNVLPSIEYQSETPAPKEKEKVSKVLTYGEPTISSSNKSRITELDDRGTSVSKLRTLDDLNTKELKTLANKIKFDRNNSTLFPSHLYKSGAEQALKSAIQNTGYVEKLDPESFNDLIKNLNTSSGRGVMKGEGDGLYNDEIEGILKKEIPESFIPVIASDEIYTLLPYVNENTERFGFIMNLDKSGMKGSHWVAVFISRGDASLEYYDSLAGFPSKQFLKDIKPLIEKMKDPVYYLVKINRIKDQSDSTDNCGYFAIDFLDKRFDGIPWKEASYFQDGIDNSKQGEIKIRKYKMYI